MSKCSYPIGLVVVLALSGCPSTEPPPGTDTGTPRDAGSDAGALDGSSEIDGGVSDSGSDAPAVDAPTCPDAGSAGGDCVLYVPRGSFGPLTAACMPRCSAATAATYRACTIQSCRSAAADADLTPGTDYYLGTVHVTSPLDCGGCIAYQEMHCFSEVCESQVDAYVDECIAGGTASSCDLALAQLDACLASLTPAEEATVEACMVSPAGPEGCFPCGG
jgi:hypothetical protein